MVGALVAVTALAVVLAAAAFAQTPVPGSGPGGMMGPGGQGYGQSQPNAGPGYGPGQAPGWGRGGMMGSNWGYGPAPQQGTDPYTQGQGYGWGGPSGMGPGMGPGMMRPWWGQQNQSGQPISIDQAEQAVEDHLVNSGYPNLVVEEVMDFENNFYAAVRETDTNAYAFELLVDPYSGEVYPEMGPNMMWNTKYGHMSGWMMGRFGWGEGQEPTANTPVTAERAVELANAYLDRVDPGTTAGEADTFYGYYTLHTERDGRTTGMLSVNGYSGQVFYLWWHGDFVDMKE